MHTVANITLTIPLPCEVSRESKCIEPSSLGFFNHVLHQSPVFPDILLKHFWPSMTVCTHLIQSIHITRYSIKYFCFRDHGNMIKSCLRTHTQYKYKDLFISFSLHMNNNICSQKSLMIEMTQRNTKKHYVLSWSRNIQNLRLEKHRPEIELYIFLILSKSHMRKITWQKINQ